MFINRTKYFFTCSAFLLILMYLIIPNSARAATSQLPIYVNGNYSSYNAISANGHWYIKLRDLCDIYCLEMSYDNSTKMITVYDKPQPTVWRLHNNSVSGQGNGEIAAIVQNGSVYVALNSVPIEGDLHEAIVTRRVNILSGFAFHDGAWYNNAGKPLSELAGYRQVGNYSYMTFKSHGVEATLAPTIVWQFAQSGTCRAVAEYSPGISDFAVADNSVYIVGRDSWNSSEVIKFSLLDGSKTRLGVSDYDYGDNLSWAQDNKLLGDIELLANTGMFVGDDGIYVPGYSRYGFFENHIIDKTIFDETYGYYRLPKDGGNHERVSVWPQVN